VAVYVDGGATPGPTPSTIVDFAADLSGRVLRVGAIPLEELRRLLPGLSGPEPDPAPEASVPDEPVSQDGDTSVVGAADDAVVTTAETTDVPVAGVTQATDTAEAPGVAGTKETTP
jgi:hypothetical protein